ncbi:MAG: T9SS type A sorting domain-containing protein [Saprospiraceae bacterium]|nr:T9SS type A sorting domain-containing protein [Saprospiraceae bacterium]MBK9631762.1 T9SS type A sorting domain-containing protein [Saprospiraceae bacterium]
MKILNILLILTIAKCTGLAQDKTFFNLIPDIGAVNGQCVFGSIECDSQYIYIIGDEVVSQDSNGRYKKVKPHLTKFDYQVNLIHSKLISEADFSKPYVRQNYPLFKRNDSIYYYNMYNWDDTTLQYVKNYIVAINMRTGQILNKVKVEQPVEGDIFFVTDSEMDPGSKELIYLLRHVYSSQYTTDNYIYTYNDSLEQLSRVKVKNIQSPISIRYIKLKDEFYHLIGDALEFKNNKLTDFGWLIYLKVDKQGNVIRENKLKTPGNIYTNGGFTYTIQDDGKNGYYIVTNDNIDVQNSKLIPHVFHVSSELDTVHWRTRFQHPLIMVDNNFHLINDMSLLNDGSGMVTCGSLHTPPFAEPSYGCIFKCSILGDSLWTRLYQPLGWDSTRGWWMSMESIKTTPYNTLVVCGRVSDGSDAMIKGWLLHLDSEGCLVPGCDKVVNSTDIQTGKEKAFTVYPNPIVSGHLNLLSRISDQSKFTIELNDLSGKVLHTSHFNPHQGTQYLMQLPNDLLKGEYLLKIQGKAYNQVEKIVIIR